MGLPKGFKHSEITKAKFRLRKGLKNPFFGKKHSKESREKMRLARLGAKMSDEIRKKISATCKRKGLKPAWIPEGEEHSNWKGDKVGYFGLHHWVYKVKGKPRYCEHCEQSDKPLSSYNWANKSHRYLRQEDDWIRLCIPCHKKYDASS